MKTTYSLVLLIAVCLLFGSCSRVTLNYGKPSPDAGTIVIKTTSGVYANITVNDSLLIGRHSFGMRYMRIVTIKNVPAGVNAVHFSADSYGLKDAMDCKLQVNVEKGKTNTQLLTVPPRSNGYFISSSVATLALFALLFIPFD